MSPFLGEFLGTTLLILFGDGVVANVVLSRSKGQNGGWIVISGGWACGVTIAVYAVNALSGAYLNPAVTIALASIARSSGRACLPTSSRKTAGARLGGVLVWLTSLPHWPLTDEIILALDQGTTSSRAIVFNHSGAVVAIPSLVERT